MATKNRSYEVQARLVLLVTQSITAESLEAAIVKSKDFKETDFVEIAGDLLDGTIRITGVYESSTEGV